MDTNTKPTLFEAKIYQSLLSSFEKLTDLRFKKRHLIPTQTDS